MRELFEKKPCQHVDVQHMLATLSVTKFYDMA